MSSDKVIHRIEITCKDCDFKRVVNPQEPPDHVINYWRDEAKAIEKWSAKSSALGIKDGHEADYDYDMKKHHEAEIQVWEVN